MHNVPVDEKQHFTNKRQTLQQAHEETGLWTRWTFRHHSSFLMSRNILFSFLWTWKTTFCFGVEKHTLSKVFTSIVADFHDFRKLFDQGKNDVRSIDRKTGRLLSEDPVGNKMLTGCPLQWATGCLPVRIQVGIGCPLSVGIWHFYKRDSFFC